jgi:hypothetical protein
MHVRAIAASNKLRKYIKKFKIGPNFKIKFSIMYYSPKKIWVQKTKKKLPRA